MGAFFSSITGFLSKYVIIGLLATVAALGATLYFTNSSLTSARNDLAAATVQIDSLRGTIKARDFVIELNKDVIDNLQDRTKELLVEQQDYNSLLERIRNATEEQNGAAADVLCIAVSGVKCMHSDPKD